ncbi:hypothetical protein TorRG33x02_156180, partial [Trema orientale]
KSDFSKIYCLPQELKNSKKVVLDQRFEAMVIEAMDVSDELRTDRKISGTMEKHLGRTRRFIRWRRE